MTTAAPTAASRQVETREQPRFVSIVAPCLNEELVVGEFVDWCKEGLERAGVEGEVVIVDSSNDRSAEIAEAHGARVIKVPKRGLGQAYIDAVPHLRGDVVIMGDCDLTYDFRELRPFIDKLAEGYEFIMGSRLKGEIEPGAMPRLHRFFGNPVTTWILNLVHGTRFSDIHCGMRAMTVDALRRIELEARSWEYASEMILKAKKLRLRSTEVPIRFLKDREGRESHLKRTGWRLPWIAGWNSLRVMFLYAPDFFLFVPGWIALVVGLVVSASLAAGPFTVGPVGVDLHWMLLGFVLTLLGSSALQLGTLARVHYDFEPRFSDRVLQLFSYNRGMLMSTVFVVIGLAPNAALVYDWLHNGFELAEISYSAVFGLLLIVLGWQTFAFTLLVHIIAKRNRSDRR